MGDERCVSGSAEGTAGQRLHLCRQWDCGVGGLLAEAAFPGAAPGRTIPGRAAEGSCRPLPPRKRTRWLWPPLLSLFLPFDLWRARSPAGSLSWPWCCLTTCSEDRAEEEAGCFLGREGLDEVGDAQALLSTKPMVWEWGGASTGPGRSRGRWKLGCASATDGLVEEWERARIPGTDGKHLIPAWLDTAPRLRALGLTAGGCRLSGVPSLSLARRCPRHGCSSGFW